MAGADPRNLNDAHAGMASLKGRKAVIAGIALDPAGRASLDRSGE